jgi:hypothetical protein
MFLEIKFLSRSVPTNGTGTGGANRSAAGYLYVTY